MYRNFIHCLINNLISAIYKIYSTTIPFLNPNFAIEFVVVVLMLGDQRFLKKLEAYQ